MTYSFYFWLVGWLGPYAMGRWLLFNAECPLVPFDLFLPVAFSEDA